MVKGSPAAAFEQRVDNITGDVVLNFVNLFKFNEITGNTEEKKSHRVTTLSRHSSVKNSNYLTQQVSVHKEKRKNSDYYFPDDQSGVVVHNQEIKTNIKEHKDEANISSSLTLVDSGRRERALQT